MPVAISESPKATSQNERLRVFLSHSNKDKAVVEELYDYLKMDGFEPWLDTVDLLGGFELAKQIEEALETAHVIVFCLSRNTLEARGVSNEMGYVFARAQRSDAPAIVPVRLEDCPVTLSLQQYIYIDLFLEDGYERLTEALRHYAEKRKIKVSPRSRGRRKKWKTLAPVLAQWASGEGWVRDVTHSGTIEVSAPADGKAESAEYDVTEIPGRYDVTEIPERDVKVQDEALGADAWVETHVDAGGKTAQGDQAKAEASALHVVVKEGLAEGASARSAVNDKPQDDIEKDTLGFRDYVVALREFITSQDTATPLTVSVNGKWGSGKSSLMRMLQRQLESPPPELAPPPRELRRRKLRWLAGWARGSLRAWAGRLLVWIGHRDSKFILLGLRFAPPDEVSDENFGELFKQFIDTAVEAQRATARPVALTGKQIEEYRARLNKKTRPWARAAARRVKMKPHDYPTVWFNAWKFGQQEQVWAALALAALEQLRNKYGFFARLVFAAKLTYRRADKTRTLRHVARKLVVPALLALVVALYAQFSAKYSEDILKAIRLSDWWPRLADLLKGHSPRWAWLAPALAAVWQALKEIDNPFRLPVEDLIDEPDYKEKVGFIATFEEDFGRIVEVAIRRSLFWQPRKLVIFIDDLDRCGPLQAASLVEAINLFLDSVGCVFILGMDVAAVATSIEVKYKELSERMRHDAPDVLSPGSLFLDKIVQIPFNVPRPSKEFIEGLVTSITDPPARALPAALIPTPALLRDAPAVTATANAAPGVTAAKIADPDSPASPTPPAAEAHAAPPPKIDRGSFAQEDIKHAVLYASGLLKENPRQVKRFINLFRLQVYIADERGLLRDEGEVGLTPRRLAVWVAWYMQWPELLKVLSGTTYHGELRLQLFDVSQSLAINEDEKIVWLKHDTLYFVEELSKPSLLSGHSPAHWSKLPWHVWLRDDDFLRCLKQLEPYWGEPRLLNSIVDMTQFSVGATPAVSSNGHGQA